MSEREFLFGDPPGREAVSKTFDEYMGTDGTRKSAGTCICNLAYLFFRNPVLRKSASEYLQIILNDPEAFNGTEALQDIPMEDKGEKTHLAFLDRIKTALAEMPFHRMKGPTLSEAMSADALGRMQALGELGTVLAAVDGISSLDRSQLTDEITSMRKRLERSMRSYDAMEHLELLCVVFYLASSDPSKSVREASREAIFELVENGNINIRDLWLMEFIYERGEGIGDYDKGEGIGDCREIANKCMRRMIKAKEPMQPEQEHPITSPPGVHLQAAIHANIISELSSPSRIMQKVGIQRLLDLSLVQVGASPHNPTSSQLRDAIDIHIEFLIQAHSAILQYTHGGDVAARQAEIMDPQFTSPLLPPFSPEAKEDIASDIRNERLAALLCLAKRDPSETIHNYARFLLGELAKSGMIDEMDVPTIARLARHGNASKRTALEIIREISQTLERYFPQDCDIERALARVIKSPHETVDAMRRARSVQFGSLR